MNERTRHQHTIRVAEADIDGLGHVNNTVYLRYIEDCVTAHAERVGMGLEQLRTLGMLPVVHRHTITSACTNHRAALLGDMLEVSTQITHFQGFRATRLGEVRREGVLSCAIVGLRNVKSGVRFGANMGAIARITREYGFRNFTMEVLSSRV